jgi:ubiquinone/menaquinone biosynthesis C-methylase UbiE
MTRASEFWDLLAPHHHALEDNYLDLASIRRILGAIQQPVLVVGAGQGLLVEELQKRGFQCDGVDLSAEMIRYAKLRRGLTLIEADARALPFGAGSYATVIYATGVIDFMAEEEEIRAILKEGRRVARPDGKLFVAFYRMSNALEEFILQVGLLKDNMVCLRRSMEMYLLNPGQMVVWVAKQASLSYLGAALLLVRMSARSTMREKATTFRMQKIFRNPGTAKALINAAQEKQPYRNEAEIRNLFQRLGIPIKEAQTFETCFMVQV